MSEQLPPLLAGRRELGCIEGIEHEAWVTLLSASPDGDPPLLTASVLAGWSEGEGMGTELGVIDPRAMAELLIEHGYAARWRDHERRDVLLAAAVDRRCVPQMRRAPHRR